MALKTKHYLMFDNSIETGNTIDMTPIIPTSKKVTLQRFGGFDPSIGDGLDSIIVVQWGNGGSWVTVGAGGKFFDMEMRRDFEGDGAKRFRIVRQNKSATAKVIVAWLEALVHDA